MELQKEILKVVRIADRIVDIIVLSALLLIIFMGLGNFWETKQMFESAMAEQYAIYKPQKNTEGYDELRRINEDVIGWINMYGTGIDYPLLQGKDNDTYIDTDPKGRYSMTGRLFLDCRNRSDFSDFNSIVYGHDMAKEAMFGGLERYGKKKYFNKHLYGSLYHDGREYGVEVFSYFSTDAYDQQIYNAGVAGNDQKADYISMIKAKSKQYREVGITKDNHILIFSTCTDEMTNGRNLLALKITDRVHKNPYRNNKKNVIVGSVMEENYIMHVSIKMWIVMIIMLTVILLITVYKIKKKRREESETKYISKKSNKSSFSADNDNNNFRDDDRSQSTKL